LNNSANMWIRSSKTLANPAVSVIVAGCIATATGTASVRQTPAQTSLPAQTPPIVKPKEVARATEDPSYKAFLDRVNEYIDLRKKLDDGLPHLKPTENLQRVETHEQLLAARVRAARSAAKPGDIFGAAGDAIRKTIREDAGSRTARDLEAAKQEVPPQDPPKVNATYPEKAPLATVPPLLLLRLPKLPEGLEYRFMGRDLILHDSTANIIVDFLQDAAPTVLQKKSEQKGR